MKKVFIRTFGYQMDALCRDNSVIQHGKLSGRVYLMKLKDEPNAVAGYIDDLVKAHGYTKVFAKIPQSAEKVFSDRGYSEEGRIPDFFSSHNDCLFMAYFCDDKRRRDPQGGEAGYFLWLRRKQKHRMPRENFHLML